MEDMNEQNEITEILNNLQRWETTHKKATFTEIEEAVDAQLTVLRKQLVEQMVLNKETIEETDCPHCGTRMMKNGQKKRKIVTKGGEAVEIKREQRRCHQCGMTIFPPR